MAGRIAVRPLSPNVGVEVRGLDLRDPIPPAEADQLRALLWDRSVLVLRDQAPSADDQVRLVEVFGTVADELGGGSTHTYVSNVVEGAMLADGRLLYHSDLTYTPAPYLVICLAAVELRGEVAPTHFASLTGGYAALPDELKARVANLTNTHVHWHLDGDDYLKTDLAAPLTIGEYRSLEEFPRQTWPLVHRHHVTGAPQLSVSQWFSHVDGMSEEASEELLAELYTYLYGEANVYEHIWSEGDVVLWDNLAVQHGRPPFRGRGAVRTLRRVIATTEGRGMAETYQLAGAAMPGSHLYGG